MSHPPASSLGHGLAGSYRWGGNKAPTIHETPSLTSTSSTFHPTPPIMTPTPQPHVSRPHSSPNARPKGPSRSFQPHGLLPNTPTFGLTPRFTLAGLPFSRAPQTTEYSYGHEDGSGSRSPSPKRRGRTRSPSPEVKDHLKPVPDEDRSGPQGSDYGRMRLTLEQLHAKNVASTAAAQAKVDLSQEAWKANQSAVNEACAQLEKGLEHVEENFERREEEYENLLSNRTEVARSLNLQLRKKSKYSQGQYSSSNEETVESLLDAISNWFVVRSTKAISEDATLFQREKDSQAEIDRLFEQGGADGTITQIFNRIQFTPELQARLMQRLRETTEGEVAQEYHQILQTKQELKLCKNRIEQDGKKIAELEELLEKTHTNFSKQRLDDATVAAGTKRGTSIFTNAAAAANRSELESLLKKKLKLIAEMEKKRAKLNTQISSLTKNLLDKDRAYELLAQAHTKLQMQLSVAQKAEGALTTTSGQRESLTQQLMARSSQQAEEQGMLKMFQAHTLWEREEFVQGTYQLERDEQIRRLKEKFDRLLVDAHGLPPVVTTGNETLQPDHLQRVLAYSHAFALPTGATPTQVTATNTASDALTKEFQSFIQLMDSIPVETELQTYALDYTSPRSLNTVNLSVPSGKQLTPSTGGVTAAPILHTNLTFPKFLSMNLKYSPLERWIEENRLVRRMRLIFDGLDHNRDGVLSILELESAYKRERVIVLREQLDNVYLAITATPPPPPSSNASSSTSTTATVTNSSNPFSVKHHHRKASSFARANHQSSESQDQLPLHSPLNFAQFLSLFNVATLRTLFDRLDAEEDMLDTNAAVRRHTRWCEEYLRQMREREQKLKDKKDAASKRDNDDPLTSIKKRPPLKPVSSVVPSAQPPTPHENDDLASATIYTSAPDLALDSAPHFTAGTKEILLYLLSFNRETAGIQSNYLTLNALDTRLEQAYRSGTKGCTTFIEKALDVFAHPVLSLRAVLDSVSSKMKSSKRRTTANLTADGVESGLSRAQSPGSVGASRAQTPLQAGGGGQSDDSPTRRSLLVRKRSIDNSESTSPNSKSKNPLLRQSSTTPAAIIPPTIPLLPITIENDVKTTLVRLPSGAPDLLTIHAKQSALIQERIEALKLLQTQLQNIHPHNASPATTADASSDLAIYEQIDRRLTEEEAPSQADAEVMVGLKSSSGTSSNRPSRPSSRLGDRKEQRPTSPKKSDLSIVLSTTESTNVSPPLSPSAATTSAAAASTTTTSGPSSRPSSSHFLASPTGNVGKSIRKSMRNSLRSQLLMKPPSPPPPPPVEEVPLTAQEMQAERERLERREKEIEEEEAEERARRMELGLPLESPSIITTPDSLTTPEETIQESFPPTTTSSTKTTRTNISPNDRRRRGTNRRALVVKKESTESKPRPSGPIHVPQPTTHSNESSRTHSPIRPKRTQSQKAIEIEPTDLSQFDRIPTTTPSTPRPTSTASTEEPTVFVPSLSLPLTPSAQFEEEAKEQHQPPLTAPKAGSTTDQAYKADDQTYQQLYEAERARVIQLERTIRLLSTPAPLPSSRHVHTVLGGSLTARSSRPTSAAYSSPRQTYALPPSASAFQSHSAAYTELISRRSDHESIRNKLLSTTSLFLPHPTVPLQPRPTSAYPRS